MKPLTAVLIVAASAAFLAVIGSHLHSAEAKDAGPSTINVSAYPSALQASYKVFAQKCSKCHNLARPINSDYVLPDEWERYIKRMMYKPDSGVDRASGKQIYEFLVYDSNVRKRALLQQKLSKLPEGQRKAAEAKIREVTAKYQ